MLSDTFPPMTSTYLNLMKNSSLAVAIGYPDLVSIANTAVSDGDTYRARFTEATSLNIGDDVRISGVRVGQVTKLTIVDRRVAEVTFESDKDYADPFNQVVLDAIVTTPDGRLLRHVHEADHPRELVELVARAVVVRVGHDPDAVEVRDHPPRTPGLELRRRLLEAHHRD